ncbi:nuclear pore membrane glycoprotein 210-like [Halichondria panicea]|uniref:nuclear pore membrane glycoprotein 210-like n=1 Tax=Halichondria panicea TaxID=6063 RepID=UPI00312BA952
MLEVGRDYAITVNVFDKMNHKIIITENVPLSTELPSLYLESHFSSLNSSYHYVRALKKGVATMHSTLSKLKHPDTGEVHDLPTLITKHQVVEINDPVQVTPKHLVILWDPQTEFKYQHQLNSRAWTKMMCAVLECLLVKW